MINPNRSPYHGQIVMVIVMLLPAPLVTWAIYGALSHFQPEYGSAFNLASAKVIGFGIGSIYHMCCWITGAFAQHLHVVKTRIKEFFADLSISFGLAITWYWNDIKTNGVAFWIDFAVIAFNFGVFVDALIDFLELMGLIS